jgi:hypothetical protein
MSNFKPTYNQFKIYKPHVKVIPKKDFLLKEDEFPDLELSVKNNDNNKNKNNNVKSFAFLLEKDEEKEKEIVEDAEDEIIPPGWSCYKYTKFKNGLCGDKNSEVTTKIQKPFINVDKNSEIVKPKVLLSEAEEIIIALSLLHEKRTNEYKELWGEAEWERMFMCPNHDYEYFDKLDEAYEIEEEKLNNKSSDSYEDSDDY